ncbi:MAG TPA: hypothetical protein VFF94_16440, partial [Novosphingobium sp.]|nr:hypothetical protein [Novosphingobium sp.]
KALTYMVNVNPAPDSEARDHHTHYMQLVPQRRYVQAFWDGNEALDRCWVPWDWCETQARQIANNSMVIFQPGNDTLHAVKANYNHLDYQRTQLYGNFWYPEAQTVGCPAWEDLDILGGFAQGARGGLAGLLPQPLKQALSGLLRNAPRDSAGGVVEKRFYQK